MFNSSWWNYGSRRTSQSITELWWKKHFSSAVSAHHRKKKRQLNYTNFYVHWKQEPDRFYVLFPFLFLHQIHDRRRCMLRKLISKVDFSHFDGAWLAAFPCHLSLGWARLHTSLTWNKVSNNKTLYSRIWHTLTFTHCQISVYWTHINVRKSLKIF